jgi:predicted Fe-Mo cluster-binding NifX family protein
MKRFVVAGLAVSLLLTSVLVLAQQDRAEKIAVAASGKAPSAAVGSQPGRAPYFLFFDKRGAFVEAVDNPYKDAGGAGISTVEFLAGKGVTVLVAGDYGPRIVEVMKGKGIRAVTFTGTAADAVTKLVSAK